MRTKDIAIGIGWLVFTAFTLVVMAKHGVLGFLTLAMRDAWALQMLLDLFLALSLFAGFVVQDAKARGLRAWPWVIAMMTMGSVGALPYLVYRRWAVQGRGTGPTSYQPTSPVPARSAAIDA